ncbi:hypothetical protein [Mycobacterium sp. E2479]|nr:hypothetical protein [Mycobacterium sp. E2479]
MRVVALVAVTGVLAPAVPVRAAPQAAADAAAQEGAGPGSTIDLNGCSG